MQTLHERLLAEIAVERSRLSRRRLLARSVAVSGGGLLAFGLVGGVNRAIAQDATVEGGSAAAPFADDVEVLNYALTLEHLEFAFYRDGIDLFDFGTDGFDQSINTNLAAIRDHEGAHVAALSEVIAGLGGTPVLEGAYNFADAYASADAFLATAAALENTGVSAYDGAAQFISDPNLLTAAGEIVAVEARHAAYLNLITDEIPFPDAFETPLTPDEVLEIAGPFIAS
jgi:hypothetical protein